MTFKLRKITNIRQIKLTAILIFFNIPRTVNNFDVRYFWIDSAWQHTKEKRFSKYFGLLHFYIISFLKTHLIFLTLLAIMKCYI